MLTARIWRERGPRYRNEASKCGNCGAHHFPPRRVCDECGSRDVKAVTMCDTGRVLTYTIIHIAPPGFTHQVPYVVAVLEMDDGARVMAQVSDAAPQDVHVGTKVRMEFRKVKEDGEHGVISYGHKAVPV